MKQYFLSNKTKFINILNNMKKIKPLVGVTPEESCYLTGEQLHCHV